MPLNNSILRGFCQKCEMGMQLTWNGVTWVTTHLDTYHEYCGLTTEEIGNPVWFLSHNQMKIISESGEFYDWLEKIPSLKLGSVIIGTFLDENPFLVAKILKQTGGKE